MLQNESQRNIQILNMPNNSIRMPIASNSSINNHQLSEEYEENIQQMNENDAREQINSN